MGCSKGASRKNRLRWRPCLRRFRCVQLARNAGRFPPKDAAAGQYRQGKSEGKRTRQPVFDEPQVNSVKHLMENLLRFVRSLFHRW